MQARVVFLSLLDEPGRKVEVIVTCAHLSRAEMLARAEGFPHHHWAVYAIAEVEHT